MPGPFGCLRTGGRFTVGTVDELQQVLHPPVVLHPSISFYYRLVLLTFRLLLLTLCQTQAQLLSHLCIVSTSRSSWGLGEDRMMQSVRTLWTNSRYSVNNKCVCVLPRHAQRTRSSSSHSTFLLSGWWKWRWRSYARSSCPRPDSPLHRTAGARMPHSPHSDGLHSRDHCKEWRLNLVPTYTTIVFMCL